MDDAYFREFLYGEKFAPIVQQKDAPFEVLERFRGKLPKRLLNYWKDYGFSGFGEGIFWITDPSRYEEVLKEWLAGTPLAKQGPFHVVARTAFGVLFLEGEDRRNQAVIDPHRHTILPGDALRQGEDKEYLERRIGIFFEVKNKRVCDYYDVDGKPLFQKVLKKLGVLTDSEMYAFVPALAAGGVPTLSNLQRVDILEQLSILVQLEEPTVLASV